MKLWDKIKDLFTPAEVKTARLIQEIEYDLAALGNSPEQVADSLRFYGMKGRRLKADSCPISNYVQWRHPGEMEMCLSIPAAVDIKRGLAEWYKLNNPTPVFQFIVAFDLGKYPDLELGLS